MLLKRITCEVPVALRAAFYQAQAVGWAPLTGIPGFRVQLGGWRWDAPELAELIAVWSDRERYDHFMAEHHDALHAASGQVATYQRSEVRVLDGARWLGDGPPSAHWLRQLEWLGLSDEPIADSDAPRLVAGTTSVSLLEAQPATGAVQVEPGWTLIRRLSDSAEEAP